MREFTEEEKQWLRDNYAQMKQRECARHLHCSDNVIRRAVKELGIFEARKTYDQKPKQSKKEKKAAVIKSMNDSGEGYCLDCFYYLAGGHCTKTGRDTGALNKKQCFKRTEE